VALFLTRIVFGRTRRVVLKSSIKTFDGVIGVTASDPQRNKVAHEQEVKDIEQKFEAGTFIQLIQLCRLHVRLDIHAHVACMHPFLPYLTFFFFFFFF
jgi:hypothetical protein